MKYTIAIFAALMFVFGFAYSQDDDECDHNDNCYDDATGTFSVYIQQSIEVNGPDDVMDCGEICPGCILELTEEQCMLFVVTGGSDCWAFVQFSGESHPAENGEQYESNEGGVSLYGTWYYWDDGMSPNWEQFNSGSEHWTTNIWPMDQPDSEDNPNEIQFMLCGYIFAPCEADEGIYFIDIGLTAEYTCPTF